MPLFNLELNRNTDQIVEDDLLCYAHTGNPGTAGTSNRVSGLSAQTLPFASWSTATNGDAQYDADVDFGVLSTTQSTTVTHYSLFRVGARVGYETLQAPVTVVANGTFSINSGTIRIDGSTT